MFQFRLILHNQRGVATPAEVPDSKVRVRRPTEALGSFSFVLHNVAPGLDLRVDRYGAKFSNSGFLLNSDDCLCFLFL